MEGTSETVVIMGGAIMGSFTGFFLKKLGFAGRVVIVERDSSYQRSSTALSAAAIRTQFSCEFNTKMSLFAAEMFRDFKGWFGPEADIGFEQRGYLLLRHGADIGEMVARQNKIGADVSTLMPDELQARFPWMNTDDLGFGTFGNRQRTEVQKIDLKDLPNGFHGYEYDVVAQNPPAAAMTSGQDTSDVSRSMSTGFYLPFTVRSTIEYGTGLQHIILLLSTPIDDVNTYFTFVIWRNDDFRVSSEDMVLFDRMIGEEDRVMLEKIPGVLPMERGALASTQSDKPSTAWRMKFLQMLGRG